MDSPALKESVAAIVLLAGLCLTVRYWLPAERDARRGCLMLLTPIILFLILSVIAGVCDIAGVCEDDPVGHRRERLQREYECATTKEEKERIQREIDGLHRERLEEEMMRQKRREREEAENRAQEAHGSD